MKDRINAAMETAGRMREIASIVKQLGLNEYAKFLNRNAAKAERWAARGGNRQSNKQLKQTRYAGCLSARWA